MSTLPAPDTNEKVQLRAIHLARLLELARTGAEWSLDDEDDSLSFLAAIELHLALQAPTTHRSYAARRQWLEGLGASA